MVAVERLLSIGVAAVAAVRGRIEAGRRKHKLAAVGGDTNGGDVVHVAATNTTTANDHL